MYKEMDELLTKLSPSNAIRDLTSELQNEETRLHASQQRQDARLEQIQEKLDGLLSRQGPSS